MKKGKNNITLKNVLIILTALTALTVLLTVLNPVSALNDVKSKEEGSNRAHNNSEVNSYAQENNIDLREYPDYLIELLEQNSETLEFVLEYPENKDKNFTIDLSEYCNSNSVPLFLQWDKRWGYKPYGDGIIATSGCGPTCLSMVAVYLLNNSDLHPLYMANFSWDNGYCIKGNGSSWILISEGAERLGLCAKEIPLNEKMIVDKLNEGKPVICVMGPGDFTSSGHFIVLTEYRDGGFKVNDPNSIANSNKIWYFNDIKDQFRNIWAMEKK